MHKDNFICKSTQTVYLTDFLAH